MEIVDLSEGVDRISVTKRAEFAENNKSKCEQEQSKSGARETDERNTSGDDMYVVLGATGNTGSVVTKKLLEMGDKVVAVGRDEAKLAALAATWCRGRDNRRE